MSRAILLSLFSATVVVAGIPVTFSQGSPAKADEVNKNFSYLDTAKADKSSVTVLQAAVSGNTNSINSLQTSMSNLQSGKVDSNWVKSKISSSQAGSGALLKANNLSELSDTTSARFARANLGLGSMAIRSDLASSDVTRALGFVPANSAGLASYLPLAGGSLSGSLSGTSATFSGAVNSTASNSASAIVGGSAGMGSWLGNATSAWFGKASDFTSYRGYLSDGSNLTINQPSWNQHIYLVNGGINAIDCYTTAGTTATTHITLGGELNGTLATFSSEVNTSGMVASGDRVHGYLRANSTESVGATFQQFVTGNGTDANIWDNYVNGSTLTFRLIGDEYKSSTPWLTVSRSGMSVSSIALGGATAVNGNLTVAGVIHASSGTIAVPDYVFEPDYKLMPLAEVESFTKANKHLPEVPSAAEIEQGGLDLAKMNLILLKKVEELTLHTIELEKRLKAVETKD